MHQNNPPALLATLARDEDKYVRTAVRRNLAVKRKRMLRS